MAGLVQSARRSVAGQVARLPEMPKPQQLDTEMAHCVCNGYVMRICLINSRCYGNPSGRRSAADRRAKPYSGSTLRTQRELLNSLLQGGDTLLLN